MNCNKQQLNITCGTDVVLHDRLIFDGETFDPNLSVDIAANLVTSFGKRTPLEFEVVDDELLITVPWIDGTLPGCYGLEVKGSCNSKKWSTYADSLIRYTKATVPGESEVTIESDSYDITQEVGYCYSNSPVTFAEVTVDDGYGTPSVDVTYEQRVLSMEFHNLKGNGITDIEVDEQVGDKSVNTVTIKTDADPEGTEFHVRNGSRGNGIETVNQTTTSTESGGLNVVTITDTDGNEHLMEIYNGGQGPQGDSVLVDQGDLPLANTISNASDKAITPKAVLENVSTISQLTETADKLYAYCIQIDGQIVSTQSTLRYISTFAVESGKTYLMSGFNPTNTGAADQKVIAAAYNSAGAFVGYFCLGSAENTVKGMVTMPSAAKTVKIFGGGDKQAPELYSVDFVADRLDIMEARVDEISAGITIEIEAESKEKYKNIAIDGSINDALSDRYVTLYKVTGGRKYLISGYNPSSEGNYCIAAWYDSTDPVSTPTSSFIDYLRFGSSESSVDEEATAPSNAAYIRIFGSGRTGEEEARLKELGSASEKMDDLDKRIKEIEEGSTSIPPLFNLPPMPKASGETLRVLCFGSSWFMNTWWYLNHIIASAGINAELHCYYVGGSNFSEWLDFYDDDITSVSSRAPRATKNISINGADWTISQKGVSGYTYQDLRDDWFADLTEGAWDIIAFQQGAASSTDWELWEDGFEVAKMLKKHASPRTHIAFNSTWAPAVSNVSILPTTGKAAQLAFQRSNWANTMRFMAKSGIANVSPGGKVMYLLRESSLNTANDLADDTLHPNNGISIYALGGAFFDTFIAPMYGVPFASVDWLPTSDTEKAIVAGTSFDAISTSARDTIREIVREAVSDRFSF